jgi:hypothetical protein
MTQRQNLTQVIEKVSFLMNFPGEREVHPEEINDGGTAASRPDPA